MALGAIPDLRAGVAHYEARKDYVTRDLFDAILASEEEHVDQVETQLALIEKTGLENYQQSQCRDRQPRNRRQKRARERGLSLSNKLQYISIRMAQI